jgi:parallel beta-helix repeat protein
MRLVWTKRLTAIIAGFLLLFGSARSHVHIGSSYYYVAPGGNDLNPGTESLPWRTLAKAASMATANVTVFIRQGTYNERLVLTKSGTAEGPITFTSYPGDSVTITGVGMTPPTGWWAGMIWIQGLSYIKISGLRVISSLNFGIDVENSSHITIEKNYVDSTYSSGMKVYASDNIVIDANEVVRGCIGSDLEECISVATVNLLEIKNNRVHDGKSIGIDVKYGSSNAIVSKNEVYNQNGGIGIYIEAWTVHEFNIEVFDNLSHDNEIGFAVTSEMGGLIEAITVHHNVAYRNRQRGIAVVGWGGGQTHPVKNIKVYENTAFENGFGIEIGGYSGTTLDSIGVFNNLIYRNKNAGVRITRYDGPSGKYVMSNVTILNNTIYGNGTLGNGWDADNGGMNLFNVSPENLLIRNNILSNNAICTIYVSPEVLAGSLTIDYNFFDGFRNFENETVGTSAIYGNPLFVDSLMNDYHLQATSPCIDKGHPNQEYDDPADPNRPSYALYPAQGTLRNDLGGYGGPYATAWNTSASVTVPSTPMLVSPMNEASGIPRTPFLIWNASADASNYRVQASSTIDFGKIIVDDSLVITTSKVIGPLLNGIQYFWRVSAKNNRGTSEWSLVWTFTTTPTTSTEQAGTEIQKEYWLGQNYPNPFNPLTNITFTLPSRSFVSLKVFDALGREVSILVSEELPAGTYSRRWNAASLPSGVYFYRLQAGSFTEMRKLVLLR